MNNSSFSFPPTSPHCVTVHSKQIHRYLSDYETGPFRVVSLTKDESLTGPVVHKSVVVAGAHDGVVAAVAAIPASRAALALLDGAPGVCARVCLFQQGGERGGYPFLDLLWRRVGISSLPSPTQWHR